MSRRALLRYVKEHDRWFADIGIGNQIFGMHCGEGFLMHIGNRKIPCRIEMGKTWYVIVEDVQFALLKGQSYLISIDL